MNKLERLVSEIISRQKHSSNYSVLSIIIGAMGSGKTTLALSLGTAFKRLVSGECYLSHSIEVIDELSKFTKNHFALILDDISFQLSSTSKRTRDYLQKLFRIRHMTNYNSMIIFVVHYARSIAPFIRSSPVKILTSINEAEVRMYSNEYLFTEPSLWDYLHYTNKYNDKYIILMNQYGRERIVDVTNIIMNECVELD